MISPTRAAWLTAALFAIACNPSDSSPPEGTAQADAGAAGEVIEADTTPDAALEITDDVPSAGDAGDVVEVVDVATDAAEPDGAAADADAVVNPDALPTALPFVFERPQAGEPLTQGEITEFTRTITGLWKDTQYFRWVRMTAHGLDPSAAGGMPDYALWWQDTQAIKEGDTIRFEHFGRADNLTLRTCKVLTNALAGYLMTGDEDMRWISVQYAKGLAALAQAMMFGADDPVPYLQARAIFTHDHVYETVGGRKVGVDYSKMRRTEDSWNARLFQNPDNPFFGDIYVVNQRSKDDVPHMYRVVPMLMRAREEAPDEDVREAAALALEYLEGFARDIVDSGYQMGADPGGAA